MADIRLTWATKKHVDDMLGKLRSSDVEEIASATGWGQEQALRYSFGSSMRAWALTVDGRAVAMAGVSRMSMFKGCMWMLATDEVEGKKMRWALAKWSKKVVAQMLDHSTMLVNWVLSTNKRALRWLEWMGFEISPPEVWGAKGELFCRATYYGGL